MEFQESPEEREIKKQAATRSRIVRLLVVVVIAVVARIFIKNPPPPKSPDHGHKPFRALPGVLASMPESQKAKLRPEMIAKLKEADMNNRRAAPFEMLAKNTYSPTVAPAANLADQAAYQEQLFLYTQRRRQAEIANQKENVDQSKTMLVLFRHGGYIKAQEAETNKNNCEILVDKTMVAQIPAHLVSSVSSNALTWKEPVPSGCTRLKPARGITITVADEIAKRITVQKQNES